jgi:hypothetical protein
MIGRTLDPSPGPHSYWNKLWRLAGRVTALLPLLLLLCTRYCTSVPPYLPPVSLHWARYLTHRAWPSTPMTGGGMGMASETIWATAIDPRCRLSTCRESTPRRAHAHAHADANLPPRDYPSTSTTSLVIFRSSKDGSGRMAKK